jgi:VWFA-related protein
MSDITAHGPRSGTKTTKVTTITKTKWLFVVFVSFVIFVPERGPSAVSRQAPQAGQPPTQAQQRPVFRGGAHFVRVDAYPSQDGKIVEGLKPEDFEILEDGKPQAIDSFDFIKFDTFAPDVERRDPISQRAGFDLAADPRYRVFVVFVAMSLSSSPGAVVANQNLDAIQQPLVNFLQRIVGPHDLFGFLTSRNSAKDLVLGQQTIVTVEQIKDLWRANFIDRDEADILLDRCDCGPKVPPDECEAIKALLKRRFRADATYTVLSDLVRQLGSLRQERKNLVLATNLLPRWREDHTALIRRGPEVPRTGIANGRITTDERAAMALANDDRGQACDAEFQRLSMLDFEPRYWQLLNDARRENVAFYVITPGGLQAPPRISDQRAVQAGYEDLKALAQNTDGLAIVDTNDLNGGMRRIADDLSAYYLLGYYSTNTKSDGTVRKITVRTKADPSTGLRAGQAIRARREYRAPTEAEIAALTNPRPAAPAPVDTGPPAVIGEPIAYRVSRAQPPEKVGLLEFVRADRLRVEWHVLAPLDRREARMLDSAGKALPFDLPVSEAPERKTVVVELPLAPFGRGVYTIELTAGAAGKTERRKLTFMMK